MLFLQGYSLSSLQNMNQHTSVRSVLANFSVSVGSLKNWSDAEKSTVVNFVGGSNFELKVSEEKLSLG